MIRLTIARSTAAWVMLQCASSLLASLAIGSGKQHSASRSHCATAPSSVASREQMLHFWNAKKSIDSGSGARSTNQPCPVQATQPRSCFHAVLSVHPCVRANRASAAAASVAVHVVIRQFGQGAPRGKNGLRSRASRCAHSCGTLQWRSKLHPCSRCRASSVRRPRTLAGP